MGLFQGQKHKLRFRLRLGGRGDVDAIRGELLCGVGGTRTTVTDGQPNLIRYAFDKPTGAFSPITGISFDANGKPVVNVLPLSAAAKDYVTVKVLSTTDLSDWSNAEEVELRVDGNGEIDFPDHGEDTRFYRVKAQE